MRVVERAGPGTWAALLAYCLAASLGAALSLSVIAVAIARMASGG